MDNPSADPNIQNAYFNQARRERARVTVHLTDGRTLRGRIKAFDRFSLILENGEGELMIFKHAISTLTTARSFGNHIDLESALPLESGTRGTDRRGDS